MYFRFLASKRGFGPVVGAAAPKNLRAAAPSAPLPSSSPPKEVFGVTSGFGPSSAHDSAVATLLVSALHHRRRSLCSRAQKCFLVGFGSGAPILKMFGCGGPQVHPTILALLRTAIGWLFCWTAVVSLDFKIGILWRVPFDGYLPGYPFFVAYF